MRQNTHPRGWWQSGLPNDVVCRIASVTWRYQNRQPLKVKWRGPEMPRKR